MASTGHRDMALLAEVAGVTEPRGGQALTVRRILEWAGLLLPRLPTLSLKPRRPPLASQKPRNALVLAAPVVRVGVVLEVLEVLEVLVGAVLGWAGLVDSEVPAVLAGAGLASRVVPRGQT